MYTYMQHHTRCLHQQMYIIMYVYMGPKAIMLADRGQWLRFVADKMFQNPRSVYRSLRSAEGMLRRPRSVYRSLTLAEGVLRRPRSVSLIPRPHHQIKRAKGGRVWPTDQVVRRLVEFQEFHIIYSSVTAFSNQCRHLMLDGRACPPCEEMAVKTCCVCGKQLHNCRERRKLHSSATSHVLPVLLQHYLSYGSEHHEISSENGSSNEEMQFTPPACTTPQLTQATPEAPLFHQFPL